MSGVTFESVTKRFDQTVAVDALSLDIADGEFMVLLGPSGCGKTTALRMIAGLDTISEGQIRIGDRVVNDVAPQHRDIAMVFQSYALYPHMTVRKNIESPLTAGVKVEPAERAQRVEEAAAILDLTPYLDRKPAALSGGQRQRVALARAIVRRPQVFLMDEPLSNLDAKLRTQTRLELVDLWRRLESTFVYVTHDQVEAMTMASRIAVLSNGKLQQVGAPQDVYERPANLFVAGFIGSPPMNTVAGTVATGPTGVVVQTSAGAIPVSTSPAVTGGTDVVAGIRPEQLRLVEAGSGDLSATVLNVELLGHERHVICDVGGARWTVREPTHSDAVTVGASVALAVDSAGVHLFDAATEARID